MKGTSLFTVLLICVGCGNPSKKVDAKIDTAIVNKKSVSVKRAASSGIDKTQILGIWTDSTSDNAVFDIRKDSIYYVDRSETYKYELDDNTITIHYPDYAYTGEVHFIKDTLVMNSKDFGVAKFWKFKN